MIDFGKLGFTRVHINIQIPNNYEAIFNKINNDNNIGIFLTVPHHILCAYKCNRDLYICDDHIIINLGNYDNIDTIYELFKYYYSSVFKAFDKREADNDYLRTSVSSNCNIIYLNITTDKSLEHPLYVNIIKNIDFKENIYNILI